LIKENIPIADLHCDLLSYLEIDSNRRASDFESNCSIPSLKEGGVILQTLAIYTETKKGSTQRGTLQFSIFQKLLKTYFSDISLLANKKMGLKPTTVVLAIENGSGILEEENESLEVAFKRLERMQKEVGTLLYLSLTWNGENRFGGGSSTQVGLKEEGRRMVDFLDAKGVAIDFSHASDNLAYDILDYIDKKGLKIIPLASHSNFRRIAKSPRNLPDDIAKEIIKRKGVIGLNFFRPFVGKKVEDFLKHIEYGIELGVEEGLCFGADFFSEKDARAELDPLKPLFFPEFNNSGCYPKMVDFLRREFSEDLIRAISYGNFERFLLQE
jgi:membrane dipeptidase